MKSSGLSVTPKEIYTAHGRYFGHYYFTDPLNAPSIFISSRNGMMRTDRCDGSLDEETIRLATPEEKRYYRNRNPELWDKVFGIEHNLS